MKTTPTQTNTRRYWPLGQIILARVREFYREPEALFWVYGFPILLVVGLGIAFRNHPVERITVDVQAGPWAEVVARALAAQEKFEVADFFGRGGSPAAAQWPDGAGRGRRGRFGAAI